MNRSQVSLVDNYNLLGHPSRMPVPLAIQCSSVEFGPKLAQIGTKKGQIWNFKIGFQCILTFRANIYDVTDAPHYILSV